MADRDTIRILVILGAIVAIIEAILPLAGRGFWSPVFNVGLDALLWNIITTIIIIVLAVILLQSVGAGKGKKTTGSGVLYIILGILLIIFGALIGGIIIIIAGIVAVL